MACWLDHDGLHGSEEMKVALRKGLHQFKLAYFQGTGGADLQLKVATSGTKKEKVPSDLVFKQ